MVDNGDGTITLRTAVTGVPEKIRLADGSTATMDAGRVVFVSVLDYNGSPTETSDDVEISSSIESITDGQSKDAGLLVAVLETAISTVRAGNTPPIWDLRPTVAVRTWKATSRCSARSWFPR